MSEAWHESAGLVPPDERDAELSSADMWRIETRSRARHTHDSPSRGAPHPQVWWPRSHHIVLIILLKPPINQQGARLSIRSGSPERAPRVHEEEETKNNTSLHMKEKRGSVHKEMQQCGAAADSRCVGGSVDSRWGGRCGAGPVRVEVGLRVGRRDLRLDTTKRQQRSLRSEARGGGARRRVSSRPPCGSYG